MENIIVTNNLCKKYGKFQALDNVSITIKKGGIYGKFKRKNSFN